MSIPNYKKELVYRYYSSTSDLSGHVYCIGCAQKIESYDKCKIVWKVHDENLGKTSNMIPICPECADNYKKPETIWEFLNRRQPPLGELLFKKVDNLSDCPPEMFVHISDKFIKMMKSEEFADVVREMNSK